MSDQRLRCKQVNMLSGRPCWRLARWIAMIPGGGSYPVCEAHVAVFETWPDVGWVLV